MTPSHPSITDPKLTVYFDGACPLCAREIGAYQTCRGADQIDWVDVSATPGNMLADDLTKDAALVRFHVRRADGALVSGGAAFADLWANLPALRWVGWVFARKPFSVLIAWAYNIFLPLRPWLQKLARRNLRA